VITLIIVVVVGYALFHLGAGHTHHRYAQARGLSPSLYSSLGRGPYASVRTHDHAGSTSHGGGGHR
jgi:hypothetical protein